MRNPLLRPWVAAMALTRLCAASMPAPARRGKLLLTGGVSTIDGAASGGLSPWAMIGSCGSYGEVGTTAFVTAARSGDYAGATGGIAVGIRDRVELSLARQDFDAEDKLAPLGLRGLKLKLKQDISGVKLRLAGHAMLDSDSLMPQIAVGLLHKRTDAGALAPTLFGPQGARDSGTEPCLGATKLFLAQGMLVNGKQRATKANQGGPLGFGGAQDDSMRLQPEISVAKLRSKKPAIGAEYRAESGKLRRSALGTGALKEDDWLDVFVAWAPTKYVSVTAACGDLGRNAPALQLLRQSGSRLSLQ